MKLAFKSTKKVAYSPLMVLSLELAKFKADHPEMPDEEALKAFGESEQGRKFIEQAGKDLSRLVQNDIDTLKSLGSREV